jgi:alanyl-tRNA synthetase
VVTGTAAERLYYDSAQLEFTARVTDIRHVSTEKDETAENAQLWQVALDRTAFYPEGGGQPWDTGVLIAVARSGAQLEVAVERVEEDEAGEVWHFVRKPLVEGTEVAGRIDFDRRTDHEQQHSGQHLLSAIFLRELGARTVSFHLGALQSGLGSSTIDLALREGMERISDAELRHVEERANRVIYENRPLTSHWVERTLAEQMLARGDLRRLPEREGPLRIVQMQGIEFNACGGTHVASTGAIGSISLRKVEKVRQGWRVEFVCGLRAVRAGRRDFEVLSGVARTLSVGAADVPVRVEKLLEERKASAKEIKRLSQELAKGTPQK